MRRILTLTLLPVFLFSIIGWQWMFFLKVYNHEFLELNRMPADDDLEVIAMKTSDGAAKSDIFFINSHEFFHHGKLFDIKFKKSTGDGLLLYCERDGAEENLLSSFDLKTQDALGYTLAANPKIQKIAKLSVFESVHANAVMPILLCRKVSHAGEGLFHLPTVLNSIFDPPDEA
jgi:hypothetical protein